MKFRAISVIVYGLLFSAIYNGLSGSWHIGPIWYVAIKLVVPALIMSLVMHYSLKRLGQ